MCTHVPFIWDWYNVHSLLLLQVPPVPVCHVCKHVYYLRTIVDIYNKKRKEKTLLNAQKYMNCVLYFSNFCLLFGLCFDRRNKLIQHGIALEL